MLSTVTNLVYLGLDKIPGEIDYYNVISTLIRQIMGRNKRSVHPVSDGTYTHKGREE